MARVGGSVIDLNELLNGCINFLAVFFIVIATGAIAFAPILFIMTQLIDDGPRAKWKHRVLYAYGYVRATFFTRKR